MIAVHVVAALLGLFLGLLIASAIAYVIEWRSR